MEGGQGPAQPKRVGRSAEKLIEAGSPLTGGLVGTAAGLLIGPFAGPPAALATAQILDRLGADFLSRRISPAETRRVGAVMTFAAVRIQERLNAGDELRDDGFFKPKERWRSDAEELAEGVLRAAQTSHEERRVRHLGFLLSSVSFDQGIPAGDANYMLDTAERLTYRQLVCLAVLGDHLNALPDWEGDILRAAAEPALLHEISHLGRNGLIARSHGERISSPDQINPSDSPRSPLGQNLYEVMELRFLPKEDRDPVLATLKELADVRPDGMLGSEPRRDD